MDNEVGGGDVVFMFQLLQSGEEVELYCVVVGTQCYLWDGILLRWGSILGLLWFLGF